MNNSTSTLHASKNNATNMSVRRNGHRDNEIKGRQESVSKIPMNALKWVNSVCCYVNNKERLFLLIDPQYSLASWLCYLLNGRLEKNNSKKVRCLNKREKD